MKLRHRGIVALLAAVGALSAAPSQADPTTYAILGIGAGRPHRINNQGMVVGTFTASDGQPHAFSYFTAFDDIGDLGGVLSEGLAVNSAGIVAGYFQTAADKTSAHGYTYGTDGVVHDNGTLGTYPSQVLAINDSGTTAGFSTTQAGDQHAFVSSTTGLTDITPTAGTASVARAINASGDVAGSFAVGTAVTHAFLYSGTTFSDLGSLSINGPSYGLAINAKKVVAGYADDSAGQHHAVTFANGKLNDLGVIAGVGAYAEDINSNGDVVGWSVATDGSGHAYKYTGGSWVDLETYLSSGDSGWNLITARAINDYGQVTGEGVDPSGNATAYILSPSPFITVATPNTAVAGSASVSVTISGIGFLQGCQAYFNSNAITTQWLSSTLLTVSIPSNLLTTENASAALTVTNPQATRIDAITTTDPKTDVTTTTYVTVVTRPASTSFASSFPVTLATAPVIQSLSKDTVATGSAGFTLTVSGSPFSPGATVLFNGTPLLTTYNSAYELTAYVPSTLLSAPSQVQISVAIGPVTSNSKTLTITGSVVSSGVHIYSAGLQMLSAPYDYTGSKVTDILDDSRAALVAYLPALNAYSGLSEYPADSLYVGRGYWARFARATALKTAGAVVTGTSFSIPLATGWNLIGDPFNATIPISSLQVLDANGMAYPFLQGLKIALIGSPLYSYNQATNAYVAHSTDAIYPYFGYWLLANTDCTLVVNLPSVSTGSTPPTAPS